MAKRRKPYVEPKPLLIVDDRNQPDPDEHWIPAHLLPELNFMGYSKQMLIYIGGALKLARYSANDGQWFDDFGVVNDVQIYHTLPALPKEFQ